MDVRFIGWAGYNLTYCETTITSGVLIVPIKEYTTLTNELDIKIAGESYRPTIRAQVEE